MRKPTRKRPDALDAFVKEVVRLWPVAKGSLARVRRPCTRPKCRACARGDRHPAWIFVCRAEGRQRCLYVSAALAPVLRRAIANGRRLEERLTRAGVELIERDRQQRRAERPAP
jgi:hypothetical protein